MPYPRPLSQAQCYLVNLHNLASFFCSPPRRQEDITNTYDVFITVVFVFGVIGIFGAGTIRYRMGFAGDVTIFQVPWLFCFLLLCCS